MNHQNKIRFLRALRDSGRISRDLFDHALRSLVENDFLDPDLSERLDRAMSYESLFRSGVISEQDLSDFLDLLFPRTGQSRAALEGDPQLRQKLRVTNSSKQPEVKEAPPEVSSLNSAKSFPASNSDDMGRSEKLSRRQSRRGSKGIILASLGLAGLLAVVLLLLTASSLLNNGNDNSSQEQPGRSDGISLGRNQDEPFGEPVVGGNSDSMNPQEAAGPTDPSVGSPTPATDLAYPRITSIRVDKEAVQTGDTFVLSMEVSDDRAVGTVEFRIGTSGLGNELCPNKPSLSSGSPNDGIWTVKCSVPPRLSAAGQFTVWGISTDTSGKRSESGSVAATLTISIPSSINDLQPPSITNISIDRQAVRPGETMTISIRASDSSGVAKIGVGIILFGRSGSDSYTGLCQGAVFKLLGGNELDGTWTATCKIPDNYSSLGDHVIFATAQDISGNAASWTTNEIRAVFSVIA